MQWLIQVGLRGPELVVARCAKIPLCRQFDGTRARPVSALGRPGQTAIVTLLRRWGKLSLRDADCRILRARQTKTRTGALCLLELLELGCRISRHTLRAPSACEDVADSPGYGQPSLPSTLTGRWPSGNSALHLLEEG